MKVILEKIFKFYIKYSPIEKGKSRLIKFATYVFIDIRKEGFLSSFDAYMNLDLSQYVDSNIFFRGEYEKNILKIIKEAKVKYGVDFFIDAGANIGQHSIYSAKALNMPNVYSFEANPYVYNKFIENLELNHLESTVNAYNLALSDDEGEINVVVPDEHNFGGGYIESVDNNNTNNKRIRSVKLDSYIDLFDGVGILKVDVEGAEKLVLKGAKKLLESRALVAIIIELGVTHLSRFECKRDDVISLLEKHGYSGKVILGDSLEDYKAHKNLDLLEMLFIRDQD